MRPSLTLLLSYSVWNDTRTTSICQRMESESPEVCLKCHHSPHPSSRICVFAVVTCSPLGTLLQGQNRFQKLCGLPVSPYFSATKMRWLRENVPEVEEALNEDRCLFGTVDSWLLWVTFSVFLFMCIHSGCPCWGPPFSLYSLWVSHLLHNKLCVPSLQNLTGGVQGGKFLTDITNASRTMLMDLESGKWSPELLQAWDIPRAALADIISNAENIGTISMGDDTLDGIALTGVCFTLPLQSPVGCLVVCCRHESTVSVLECSALGISRVP